MTTLLNFTEPIDLFFESDYFSVPDDNDYVLKLKRKLKIDRVVVEKKKSKENKIMYCVFVEDFYPYYKNSNVDDIREFKTLDEAKEDFDELKEFIRLNIEENMILDDMMRYMWRFKIEDNKFKWLKKYLGFFDGKWV